MAYEPPTGAVFFGGSSPRRQLLLAQLRLFFFEAHEDSLPILVGALVAINFIFPLILGCCHHPNWRTHIFQRGGPTTNHQPEMYPPQRSPASGAVPERWVQHGPPPWLRPWPRAAAGARGAHGAAGRWERWRGLPCKARIDGIDH